MKQNIVIAVLVGLVLGLGLAIFAPEQVQNLGGNAYEATTWKTASTTYSWRVGASRNILATSTTGYTRAYAHICNNSASIVWFNLDADKPAASSTATTQGFPVAANTCYDITGENLYQGSIQ